ncbi:MAG: nuclease-related domain-containing protein, partial [Verrucomicrobiales bacterium]|nr:nuclease-related domain-containing protein [Verrucomicrobiales bacterium]
MTESKAAQLLHQYFPYCVLSEVPLFRPDTSESHLYAHKLDFLLHLKKGEEEKLVIIECKDNILKGKKGGRPISEESKMWVAQYFGAVKDARKQVRSQTRALYHNLDLQRNGQPKIEGWVVHSGRHSAEIRHDYDDGVTLMALTSRLLKSKLERMREEGWRACPILGSQYLWQLQLGRNEIHLPHPAFRDALAHVRNCRRAIDSGVFVQLRVGKIKRSNWAISGSAGSGKSVLLAYSACVFATDHWIQRGHNGSILKVITPVKGRLPARLPEFGTRKIFVYAMSHRQIEALKRYFNRFKEEFMLLAGDKEQPWEDIEFGKWSGTIAPQCNVMLIDEAQDLSLEDQLTIKDWHESNPDNYLAVSIDRQQQLQHSAGTPKIIEGMNFSGKTTPMTRSYRQPFPAAISGTALLFRWLSRTGPMIQTDRERIRVQKNHRNSLVGCLGARVD